MSGDTAHVYCITKLFMALEQRFVKGYFGTGPVKGQAGDPARMLTRFKRKTLVAFIQSLPEGARVLDVGCGSGKGFHLIRLFRNDLVLTGIDIADLGDYMPEGVTYIKGDIAQLSSYVSPESFDAIICQHVVEHIVYPGEVIEEMKKALVPGGQLFLETPNWTRMLVPFSHLYFYNDYTHVRPYTKYTLHRLLSEYDMEIRSIEAFRSVPFSSPREVAQEDEGATNVSKPKRQIFKRSLAARIAARLINPLVPDVLVAVAKKK